MKKAVRKGASKAVALVLSLAMIFGMAPMVSASAGNTADAQDNFDRIVHLDMGRKYYSPEWIKALIREISALGYTELELDFSNNEGFRFSLPAEQMQIEVGGYETVLVEVEPEEGAQDAEEPVTAVPLADEDAAVPAPTSTAQPEEGESEPAVTDEPESTPQYKEVEVFQSKTVDLSQALSKDGYITAEDMKDIIACADEAGIEIVPLLNSPGHMGAILSVYQEYRWTDDLGRTSNSTINLENDEAVRFAQGMVRAYARWFAELGCTAFNIGADEFANDIGGVAGTVMGLDYIYNHEKDVYSKLIAYINDLANIVKVHDMTPRAFNDSFCYNNDTAYAPIKDIQICYWSPGWPFGYNLAKASTLEATEYQLINTHGDYYYVLGKNDSWDSNDTYRYDFNNNLFAGGSSISAPVGSMFCIWSDDPNAETEKKVAEKVRVPLRIMAARMQDQEVSAGTVDTSVIPGGFNADGTINVPAASVTDETTNITVSAAGVTSISAVKYEDEISELVDSTYFAYDIKLNGGDYTQSAQVSIPLPDDWSYSEAQLCGFVLSSDGKVEYADDGSLNNGVYTFTAPHFSTVGVVARTGDVEYVTVAVGETKTYSLTGEQKLVSNSNSDFAMVSAEYQAGVGSKELKKITQSSELVSGAKYLIENQSAGNLLMDEKSQFSKDRLALGQSVSVDSEELWTITDSNGAYTIQNAGGQYLTIGDTSAGVIKTNQSLSLEYKTWTASGWGGSKEYRGWYIGQNRQYLNNYMGFDLSAAGYSSEKDAGSLWNLYQLIETPAEGSTTVTISGIGVGTTTAVVGNTTYVITVTPEDLSKVDALKIEYWITNSPTIDTSGSKFLSIDAGRVNFEAGVDVASLLPATTMKSGENRDLEYWRCRLLDKSERNSSTSGTEEQTEDSGDDETYNGTGFTKVRYWNGEWSVYTEDNVWVTVENNHQLVAYYLEILPVADELMVTAADWGKKCDGSTTGYLEPNNVNTISIQVIYEDGTTNPGSTTAEALRSKTIAYNFWTPARGIGTLNLKGLEDYQIWKVEAETGSMAGYATGEKPAWGTYTVTNFEWDNNPVTVYEGEPVDSYVLHNSAKNPSKNGYYENLMWDEAYEAILIKVYVKAAPREDSLTVHYVDSGTNQDFYSYNITVAENTTFDIDIALGTPWKGPLANGTVENIKGISQTVTADLTTLTQIGAQYRFSDYTCTEVVRSKDGKEVFLYYIFNNTHSFVVDFGLPVTVTANDLGIGGTIESVNVTGADYGSVSISDTSTMTYTPTEMMNGIESLNYTVTVKMADGTEDTATHTIYLIPASTVYYEDTFEAIEYGEGWETVGTTITDRAQTTSKLGDKAIYGYDAAYATDTAYSGGSAHKVTLSSGQTATATFSFHGTGFQLVSMTDATSGCITVHVKGNGVDKYYFVDNYYASGTLYQVPVMKVDGLDLGTYTVTVTAGHLNSSDWNKDKKSTFVLDGIRIYKPIGDYAGYAQDNEGGAVYSEIRNILLFENGWAPDNKVYVDTLGESTNELGKYLKVGPNNEVYLKQGDQITFTVPADEGGSIVQIGAKLVSDGSMTFNDSETISTATEMYYLLDGVQPGDTITITAAGDGILSLTNLKLVSGS